MKQLSAFEEPIITDEEYMHKVMQADLEAEDELQNDHDTYLWSLIELENELEHQTIVGIWDSVVRDQETERLIDRKIWDSVLR